MSGFRFPTIFLSHGTPMLAFGDDPVQHQLGRFAQSLPKPKAIIVVSAHSVSSESIHVLKSDKNWIQHDFTGFPDELYNIQYNCPGDPDLADRAAQLLRESTFDVKMDEGAPLDHGIWVPLMHLYPKADVPVVRISLPLNLEPAKILRMGKALSSLREQGVMMVGTGGAVHNLRELKWEKKTAAGAEWAQNFEEFLVNVLKAKDVEVLIAADQHPDYARAQPSPEHFLPIFFTVGAALTGDEVEIIHRGIEYDSLSMLCFSLNNAQKNPSLH